jgi:translation initiation factor IF-2
VTSKPPLKKPQQPPDSSDPKRKKEAPGMVRIFQLAKELDTSSKELIKFLHTQGHRVGSHMSGIPELLAQILRDRYKPKIQKEREKVLKEMERGGPSRPKPVGGSGSVSGSGAAPPTPVPPKSSNLPFQINKPVIPPPPPPGAERGRGQPDGRARPSGPVAPGARPAAAGAPRGPGWSETAGDREKEKEREKDKEATERERRNREKESPTRVRYFPTKDDYEGPHFGGGKRRLIIRPKARKADESGDGTATALARPEKIEVALPVTVKELCSALGVKASQVLKALMQHGHPVHINQFIDEEMVTIVSLELGIDVVTKKKSVDVEDAVRQLEDLVTPAEDLRQRAPVVTFMGHVDHGKTSLLDKIRETSVTLKEAGGITQHLGAYRVDKGKSHVVFIDTPGHQAFTEMRARGAVVTDVVVLVVAADDGVMPQTIEALNHARAAKVPVVVAINKMDKPTANAMRVKQQLSAEGLQPVEWGGDTEFVEVSAQTSQGLDTLLETLSLTSEILELRANPNRPAIGVVLEAQPSTSRGVLATVLVREGTLRVGDYVLCGPAHGRVKSMLLNGSVSVKEAGPSTPVEVAGLGLVPHAGDKLYVVADVQQARDIAEERERKQRELERGTRGPTKDKDAFGKLSQNVEEVRVILKTDVRGSMEALRNEISSLSTEEVKVKILHAGVGTISQSDISLAATTEPHALIVGFNVSADERARDLAEERKVEIRHYDIIYKVIDDVRAAMQARLAPQIQEEIHGRAQILEVFRASKVGNIAGCRVASGFILRSDKVRLIRDGKIIHTGTLSSLKRFKDDAREVKEGFECGLKVADYDDIKVDDVIEAFAMVEKARQL